MRGSIARSAGNIIKSYKVSSELKKYYELYFHDYLNFIRSIGYIVPETEWYFSGNNLTITQIYVDPIMTDYGKILDMLLQFEGFEGRWGLDANPLNFIQDKTQINFIDFNPLLYDERSLLTLQFDYDYALIYERFFKQVNIVTTFLIRINLIDTNIFQELLLKAKRHLYNNFNSILPREKLRLLGGITNKYPEGVESYSEFYKSTKNYNQISIDKEILLMSFLSS